MIGISPAARHEAEMEMWLGWAITDLLVDAWESQNLTHQQQVMKSEVILKEVTGKDFVFV